MRAPGHGLHAVAAVRVDLDYYRVPAHSVHAGAGRRGDHAADGQVFRHQLLRCGRRRRPGHVPAHILVLRPPGGVYPDPAGVRHRLADHPDVFPQAAVRV